MTESRAKLVRAIGTFGLAAGIINITIGGGIFVLPATVAQALGPSAPLAYLICAAAMALIVLCIADAGNRVSLTGGPYAYVGTAFGPYAAFLSGVLLWMLGVFATAAVANAFAITAGVLAPAFAGRAMQAGLLAVTLIFWSVVNVRGVTLGVRLNSVATVAKLFPLLLVAIGGAFFIQPENLRAAVVPEMATIARSSLVLIFAFAGIECALVPSGEVRDPARTVPRAIAMAMVAITVLYIALQTVAQGVLGDALTTTGADAPLAEAAGASLGGWARSLLLVGAAVSMFGYLGGMTLSMPRILFALAQDRFLPKALAQVHPVYHSPHVAIILQSSAALLLALSGTFEQLAILANASALALYFGCALASWRLRQRGVKGEGTPLAIPGAAVIPWITCAVIGWLLTGLRSIEWLGFTICVGIASLIYVLTRAGRENTRRQGGAEKSF
jgi:APA family basic amino acid/polyamine antiporter